MRQLVVGECWQDWLAKSREEVEGFSEGQVSRWTEAVLNEGKVRDELIQQTVTTLQQQGVAGNSLLELTLEQMMQDGIPRGPAVLLTKKIRLLNDRAFWYSVFSFVAKQIEARDVITDKRLSDRVRATGKPGVSVMGMWETFFPFGVLLQPTRNGISNFETNPHPSSRVVC